MADQFSAQLQAMRKERDGALRRGDRLLMQMDDLRRKHTALQAQLAEARGFLVAYDRNTCPICAWTLGTEGGACRPGDCRYRPEPLTDDYAQVQYKRDAMAAILAQREPSEATQEGGG